MKPFLLNKHSHNLVGQYLDSSNLYSFLKSTNYNELVAVIHQWISEGIPYAFKNNPLIYEYARLFISQKLEIHPKDITIVGSSRLGFTLKSKNFGMPFNKKSDLDITFISQKLFDNCKSEFEHFLKDYTSNEINPNNNEKVYWKANIIELPKNIEKGFIDSWRVPNRYPTFSTINNVLWHLKEKLQVTESSLRFSKITARTYNNWGSFTNQLLKNLRTIMDLS